MLIKSIVAAAACVFIANVALAQSTATAGPASSATSRADVKAETKRAMAAGELKEKGETYSTSEPAKTGPGAKRADVKAEERAAQKAGELDNTATKQAPAAQSSKTRAEVKQELATARANGTTPASGEAYPDTAGKPAPKRVKKAKAKAASAAM